MDLALERGAVDPRVAAEHPALALLSLALESRPRRSPEPVREWLRRLSDRIGGAQALHLRERPVPWAYRVFFRQIGLDPDVARTPVEALVAARISAGEFRSRGLPADAVAIATVETGVALVALDADRLEGELTIGVAGEEEAFDPGTLVLADRRRALGPLFAEPEEAAVGDSTRRVRLAAIGVEGVAEASLAEALWVAARALET